MTWSFTKEEATSILEGAFAPLRCTTETYDRGNKVRVRVIAPDGTILLNADNIGMQRLQTMKGLSNIVALSRQHVESNGYLMAPWQLPSNIYQSQ